MSEARAQKHCFRQFGQGNKDLANRELVAPHPAVWCQRGEGLAEKRPAVRERGVDTAAQSEREPNEQLAAAATAVASARTGGYKTRDGKNKVATAGEKTKNAARCNTATAAPLREQKNWRESNRGGGGDNAWPPLPPGAWIMGAPCVTSDFRSSFSFPVSPALPSPSSRGPGPSERAGGSPRRTRSMRPDDHFLRALGPPLPSPVLPLPLVWGARAS